MTTRLIRSTSDCANSAGSSSMMMIPSHATGSTVSRSDTAAVAEHRRAATGVRLNLGCGRDIRPGWVNVDSVPLPGVDVATDFDHDPHLPFADGTVGYSEGSHVLEHLADPLPFMAELWRVTRAGGQAVFCCPCGSTG